MPRSTGWCAGRLQDEIDTLRRRIDIPLILVTHAFDDVVRLATHLLILEQGRGVASGSLGSMMSRPDLTWLRQAVGLGSLFDATVARVHPSRALVELAFDGGTLFVAGPPVAVGSKVRLRIPAREVILATSAPEGLSLHNVLSGTVSAVHADPAFDHVIVQIAVGSVKLLAEVTPDAVEKLGIVRRPSAARARQVRLDRCRQDRGDRNRDPGDIVSLPRRPRRSSGSCGCTGAPKPNPTGRRERTSIAAHRYGLVQADLNRFACHFKTI